MVKQGITIDIIPKGKTGKRTSWKTVATNLQKELEEEKGISVNYSKITDELRDICSEVYNSPNPSEIISNEEIEQFYEKIIEETDELTNLRHLAVDYLDGLKEMEKLQIGSKKIVDGLCTFGLDMWYEGNNIDDMPKVTEIMIDFVNKMKSKMIKSEK
jgi:hypothetical protein